MAKRTKRLMKGTESLKKEIEKHFEMLEEDIAEGNIEGGRYHAREIDKSLIASLELKIKILDIEDNSVEVYNKRLEELKKKLEGK